MKKSLNCGNASSCKPRIKTTNKKLLIIILIGIVVIGCAVGVAFKLMHSGTYRDTCGFLTYNVPEEYRLSGTKEKDSVDYVCGDENHNLISSIEISINSDYDEDFTAMDMLRIDASYLKQIEKVKVANCYGVKGTSEFDDELETVYFVQNDSLVRIDFRFENKSVIPDEESNKIIDNFIKSIKLK